MNSHEINTGQQIEKRYERYAEQAMATNEPLPFNIDGYAPKNGRETDKLADRLYAEADLIDLPEPVINASIGCGNPLAMASIKSGEHVLDLGSGGGIDCFMAAKSVGSEGHVIGVDATQSMIELANQNKQKMGLDNVEFRHGRIEELPVASNSIDLIISNCVIDISPDKTSVFQEAFRVLQPGGRIAISDTIIMGEIPPTLKANIDTWSGAVITPLIPLSEFLAYMIEAGFADIQVESLTSYGLENFDALDEASQKILTDGIEWAPLPPDTGLYSASIWARKP